TGKLIVGNNSSRAITYTKPLGVTNQKMRAIADELVKFVSIKTDSLTSGMKAEYYLANVKNYDFVKEHIKNADSLDSSELNRLMITYVRKHGLVSDMTNKEKEAAIVYNKMSGAYALSSVYIKTSGVSDTEMAEVGENLSSMPGIKIGTDWTRSYPDGTSIRNLAGTVTTEKHGLPDDSINTFLAQGYSRNDSVGSSYLEKQYQDVLKGTKKTTKVFTQNGKITKEVEQYGGQAGDDVQLTINAKFQQDMQKIMDSAVAGLGGYSNGGYAVAINPHTGGIYGMAGVYRDPNTGKTTVDPAGAINQSITMGSVVKPAMIIGALKSGVITPDNNVLTDMPIKVKDTPVKGSWFNKSGGANVALTASDALMVSSNSYMMQLAMKEAGFKYSYGATLTMPTSIFKKLRNNFNEFGLGVRTGIDLPGEVSGLEGKSTAKYIGSALDLSYGNYDSYTTIQLAQYASILANKGYKIQPHLLQSIRANGKDGKMGAVKYEVKPNITGVIDVPDSYWDIIHSGMYKVVHGTSQYATGTAMKDINPAIAAKTGTAETVYKNTDTITLSAISYAPYDDPQVVVVVAFPNLASDKSSVNMNTLKSIYEAYWKDVQSSDGYKTSK
ncbi:penicillin-binding protein 2, partial [Lactobacillus salivarius]|nr:penicillin-binding protein 2 [Ligilactobacillus salivarius]